MDKNQCPYCGERITNWKKWQLTDNRYGKKCPNCSNIIRLPKTYVRFIQVFNIFAALVLVAISYSLEKNNTLFLGISALFLIPLNIILLQIPRIKRDDE